MAVARGRPATLLQWFWCRATSVAKTIGTWFPSSVGPVSAPTMHYPKSVWNFGCYHCGLPSKMHGSRSNAVQYSLWCEGTIFGRITKQPPRLCVLPTLTTTIFCSFTASQFRGFSGFQLQVHTQLINIQGRCLCVCFIASQQLFYRNSHPLVCQSI